MLGVNGNKEPPGATVVVGGLSVDLYGSVVAEVTSVESCEPVPVHLVLFLHWRGGSRAHKRTRIYCNALAQHVGSQALVAAFDQRNHGERLVDEVKNLTFDCNPNHAADMFSHQFGTARDAVDLVDMLSARLHRMRTQSVHVVGVSLGGHSALLCAIMRPQLTSVVSFIGAFDYRELMRIRWDKHVSSHSLSGEAAAWDRVWTLGLDTMWRKYGGGDAVHTVVESLRHGGVHVLVLNGAVDTLVPAHCNDALFAALGVTSVSVKAEQSHVTSNASHGWSVYEGVAHEVPEHMWCEGVQWIHRHVSARVDEDGGVPKL